MTFVPGEFDQAVALANRVLDRPNGDPDDDLAVLARQFMRTIERDARLLTWWRMEGGETPGQKLTMHADRDRWHNRYIAILDPVA